MIIKRYLLKEISISTASVIGVLLIIFASKHFVRYMSDAAAGELPTYLIIKLLSLFTLASLVLMVPLALYIGVLISLGRMYKDSEMTAMHACGFGVPQVLHTVLLLALVLATLVGGISLWIAPWAEQQQYAIRDQAAVEAEFSFLEAGRFHEIRDGKGVFYIEHMSEDRRQMQNVFVFIEDEDKVDVFSARTGRHEVDSSGYRYLILEDGFRYELLGANAGYRVHEYQESGIRITHMPIQAEVRPRVAWPTAALLEEDDLASQAEFQWRVAMPVSVIMVGLLSVLLSRSHHRQGRFGQLFFALLIYIAYIYLLMLSRTWIKHAVLPPNLGMWWVHVLALVGIGIMYLQQQGWIAQLMYRGKTINDKE